MRLLRKAYGLALLKSECLDDYIWNFYVFDNAQSLADMAEQPFECSRYLLGFNCNKLRDPIFYSDPYTDFCPHSCLFIDRRALFAALTGVCHWNNLEIGSCFLVRRYPGIFLREAQNFLNFLTVI